MSEYEVQRLKNIEYNKSVLLSLGLPRLAKPLPSKPVISKPSKGVKRKRDHSEKKRIRNAGESSSTSVVFRNYSGYMTRSRGLMVKEIQDPELNQLPGDTSDDDDEEYVRRKSRPKFSENVFGIIPDVAVGTAWPSRLFCSHDGIHRPTVAGIHGGEEGCYSLALSGGYEDDLDYGDCFTYTGEGGRDLKGTKAKPKNLRTAPQSKDQTLTRGNLALSKNVESCKPVRVVRGYKLKSDYAPIEGYRYDGLYTVERYWNAVGLSGYVVYKFALKRCADQVLPPWEDQPKSKSSDENDSCYGSEESTQSQS